MDAQDHEVGITESEVRRLRAVVGMMTATIIAASTSLTAGPVAADPIKAPGAVTCQGLFARNTSYTKLVAAFGVRRLECGRREEWSPD